MQPFQQRVIEEKKELDQKIDRLVAFTKGLTAQSDRVDGVSVCSIFHRLPPDEQLRLARQLDAMQNYSGILAERIAHFCVI